MIIKTDHGSMSISRLGPCVILDVQKEDGKHAYRWIVAPDEARVIANAIIETATLADASK